MNDEATMQQPHSGKASVSGSRTPGLLAKLLTFILSAGLFVLAFMFSLAALAVVAIAGVLFAVWFWWKTRSLRRQFREQGMAGPGPSGGQVIEGEVIRDSDAHPTSGRLLR